jgi:hypothetical protein
MKNKQAGFESSFEQRTMVAVLLYTETLVVKTEMAHRKMVCRPEVLRDGSNKVLFRFVEGACGRCVFPCK